MSKIDLNSNYMKKVMGKEGVYCTLGGDPEFFVAEKASGTILNTDRFFPPKTDPLLVLSGIESRPNKLYFDGIQAEMGFAYAQCRDDVNYNIKRVMKKVEEVIGDNHTMVLSPAVKVKKAVLRKAHPEARVFGCMPDYNAYTLTTNTPEMDASTHPYRYAGGHIHLGWSTQYGKEGDPEHDLVKYPENHIRAIRFLDLIVSLVTLPLDNAAGSKQRRDKYGKAGCFRPTPYGIEYRTPSCWWLSSPATTSLVLGLARAAWNMLIWGVDEEFRALVDAPDETVQGIVNEGDTKASYEVWKRMRPYFAMTGKMQNPLHLNSCAANTGTYWDNCYKEFRCPIKPDQGVSALASFEYVVKNGLDTLRNPDPFKAWCSNPYGFTSSSYMQFNKNPDFMKFQKEFLEKTILED